MSLLALVGNSYSCQGVDKVYVHDWLFNVDALPSLKKLFLFVQPGKEEDGDGIGFWAGSERIDYFCRAPDRILIGLQANYGGVYLPGQVNCLGGLPNMDCAKTAAFGEALDQIIEIWIQINTHACLLGDLQRFHNRAILVDKQINLHPVGAGAEI